MIRKSLVCAALLSVGCGRMDAEESFRAALPTRDMVEVKAPQQSGQGLEAEVHAHAEQGQSSELYQFTRGAAVVVNGGTLAVLGLLEAVTKHRPTSLTEDTAVWGPHTETLSPNTWRLTVSKVGESTYSYTLEAKAKGEPDTAFRAILTGQHTSRADATGEPMPGYGSGEFTLDWDQEQTLPEHGTQVGQVTARYTRADDTSAATLEAEFRQVRDDQAPNRRVDANYAYKSTPGAGGEFDFVLFKNGYGSTAPERLAIKSRWQQAGAGRSDVKLSGGDLPGEATLNECWDATFASRFLRVSYDPRLGYGTEATDCAFTPAVYSSL